MTKIKRQKKQLGKPFDPKRIKHTALLKEIHAALLRQEALPELLSSPTAQSDVDLFHSDAPTIDSVLNQSRELSALLKRERDDALAKLDKCEAYAAEREATYAAEVARVVAERDAALTQLSMCAERDAKAVEAEAVEASTKLKISAMEEEYALLSRQLAESHNRAQAAEEAVTSIEAVMRTEVSAVQASLSQERQRRAELEDRLERALEQTNAAAEQVKAISIRFSDCIAESVSYKKKLERTMMLLCKTSGEELRLSRELQVLQDAKRQADAAASATAAGLRELIAQHEKTANASRAKSKQVQTKMSHLNELLTEMERRLRLRETEVTSIVNTISWKVTSPIRRVARGIAKARQVVQRRPYETPHFDAEWYISAYPDVSRGGMDPYEHYLTIGAAQGRNPNALFDTAWYLRKYLDVRMAGMNAHSHFLRHGIPEGRQPHPDYTLDEYLALFPRS